MAEAAPFTAFFPRTMSRQPTEVRVSDVQKRGAAHLGLSRLARAPALIFSLAFISLSLGLVACGDDSGGPFDSGVDAAEDGSLEDASDSETCFPRSCQSLIRDGAPVCGLIDDGCGGTIDCSIEEGSCAENRECVLDDDGISRCRHRGEGACSPLTREAVCVYGTCGHRSDGCASTIDCGGCAEGEHCALGVCSSDACEPLPIEVACAGKCGRVSDGCDGAYECTPPAGGAQCNFFEYCGFGGTANECGCTPLSSCEEAGAGCGMISDRCGGILNCWDDPDAPSCPMGETCVGSPPICRGPSAEERCEGPLCEHIPWDCPEGAETSIVGLVLTPDEELRIPNAVVYIPQDPAAELPAIREGVIEGDPMSCERCESRNESLGPILVGAVTDEEGRFVLSESIPVGAEFKLVVVAGKWRRVVTIPRDRIRPCTQNTFERELTRLPASRVDGEAGTHFPKIAIATGQVDAMECVLYKMGFAPEEFSTREGAGSIHLYRSPALPGTGIEGGGQICSSPLSHGDCVRGVPASIDSGVLIDTDPSNGDLFDYDLILWDCEGEAQARNPQSLDRLRRYADSGGRFFASDLASDWLRPAETYADAAEWIPLHRVNSDRVYLSFGRAGVDAHRIRTFARWLAINRAANLFEANGEPHFAFVESVLYPRDHARSVGEGVDEWVYRTVSREERSTPLEGWPGDDLELTVQQFSFNTPLGAAPEASCGRVAFSSFHVVGAEGTTMNNSNQFFPAYCPGDKALSSQEKLLAYMLFDLAACIGTGDELEAPICTPATKEALCSQPGACGERSDGCGGIVVCDAPCECTPRRCEDELGPLCGLLPDGCGGYLDCGGCSGGSVCHYHAQNRCGRTG